MTSSRIRPWRTPAPFAALALLAILSAAASCNRNDLAGGPDLSGYKPPPPPPPPECPERQVAGLRVKINEVLVVNEGTLADKSGKYPPWIEFYNSATTEVDLSGVSLKGGSDDSSKWVFPCKPPTLIAAKGFLIIFADGGSSTADEIHTAFTLLPDRPVDLMLNKGSNLFSYEGPFTTDVSVGRTPDGAGSPVELDAPTPGAANQTEALPAEFVRGDANGDGRITVTDMTEIQKYLDGINPPLPCQDVLDANDDGRIDAQDPVYIGDFLFLHGPALPPPYPEAGPDPTEDGLPCTGA